MLVQLAFEMDGQLRERQVPVLDRMRPALGRFEYAGIEELKW